MKEITVLSGKGGTGKTSITAALATVVESGVFCDTDVDAADLHLVLHPSVQEEHTFISGWTATINPQLCKACGLCSQHCRFEAIHTHSQGEYYINPFQCEGCRLCERVCPQQAIYSKRNSDNFWYVSSTRFGTLVHAHMDPGEENSGKLVSQVRAKAKELARNENRDYILSDGPPGIGCATISSLSGTHQVLLVIEPTRSGWHDAERLLDLAATFQTGLCAVINKYDISPEISSEIEASLNERGVPLLARIPFDEEVVWAMEAGKTILEYRPESPVSHQIRSIWEALKNEVCLSPKKYD